MRPTRPCFEHTSIEANDLKVYSEVQGVQQGDSAAAQSGSTNVGDRRRREADVVHPPDDGAECIASAAEFRPDETEDPFGDSCVAVTSAVEIWGDEEAAEAVLGLPTQQVFSPSSLLIDLVWLRCFQVGRAALKVFQVYVS